MASTLRVQTFPSATITTNTDIPLTVFGAAGLVIDISVTAITGTSITHTLQFQNAAGVWKDLIATTATSAAGDKKLILHPGATAAANVVATEPPRRNMRIHTTGTFTSVTQNINVTYVPS